MNRRGSLVCTSAVILIVLFLVSISSCVYAETFIIKPKNEHLFHIITKNLHTRQSLACYQPKRGKILIGRIFKKKFHSIDVAELKEKEKKALLNSNSPCRRFLNQSSHPTPTPTPSTITGTPRPLPAIPNLTEWEEHMTRFGLSHCETIESPTAAFETKLDAIYYDAQLVFQQIKDYTKSTRWDSCANSAEKVYRDQYIIPNNGSVPGNWLFPIGLARDYLSSGDATSKQGLDILATTMWAADATPLAWTTDTATSREVAYAIMAYLMQEDIGEPRRVRLAPFVDQALGHLDQWFVKRTAPYIRPFMVGLTAHSLIEYYERTKDPRIVPALTDTADKMWNELWLQSDQSFKYTDRNTDSGGMEPSPDLSLLIAPMYGWLFHQTGEMRFLERGDLIFAGGVQKATIMAPKQFNQSYRWSFSYVKWRSEQPLH